eukprot:CAMPEP_0175040744 /NCGR_PEP_ID=MMETSP0052_2-20121109/1456_1 /TAXON_ID=51329 ORGANISM="Polytomella parva, Strain SAG 63-3" /NCGR_SAMPLE_ID=MMETSP0052_2 /ASSEMBLY_ACC=CAM_ASM_000194 /LENGTH=398 /DNA_ID=CAMNT_0016303035 /DNA_START=92 /DNA_END=1285 /DNA_ORIENTATION=-
MCTIEKLLIKGIRSFSPENEQAITFYKPITLIVGANGAGKTTIIEALRNACTGELPPNCRQGHSFIMDPKVAKETEVKALVKLRFRTAAGQPVVITRLFQLTQKKSQLQFKSLDATLLTADKSSGTQHAVSRKCADIDRAVPAMMGVSKAVLENVIFVHQEESSWPLAEAKVLKDKFDDIFAATKYTRAVESLRKLRLEKAQGLREAKLMAEAAKNRREQALALAKDKTAAMERAAAAERGIAGEEKVLKQKLDELSQAEERVAAAAAAAVRVRDAQAKLEVVERRNHELYDKLPSGDLDETDEELAEHLVRFEADLDLMVRQRERWDTEAVAARKDRAAAVAAYEAALHRHGQVVTAVLQLNEGILDRDFCLYGIAGELGLIPELIRIIAKSPQLDP